MTTLTHVDNNGSAHMVDVGSKDETEREATAYGCVHMLPETLEKILDNSHKKGDVLAVARIAGIQAAKRTSDLIPLCHPLMLSKIQVELTPAKQFSGIELQATVKLCGRTGVEMEALTAVSVGALTIYDMCKAVDRGMKIEGIQLIEKKGGESGHWRSDAQ